MQLDHAFTVDNLHEALIARVPELRRYLDKHIPRRLRSRVSADDVLQEVWIAAYRTFDNVANDDSAGLDRWLATITRTKLVDCLRHHRRAKRGSGLANQPPAWLTSLTGGVFAGLDSPGATPSGECHVAETGHTILMLLNRLSERQQIAIRLHFIDGLGRAEIAERLQTTEAAVSSLLYHGLRQLRELLGSETRYFSDAR